MTLSVKRVVETAVLLLTVSACTSSFYTQRWVSIDGALVTEGQLRVLIEECDAIDETMSLDELRLEQCLLESGVFPASRYYEITPYIVKATAFRLNADTPLMVDNATRLDSVESNGRTLRLNHTIIDDVVEDINVVHFQQVVPDLVLRNTCYAPPMTVLMENDVIFQYSYSDAEGKPITEFSISLPDCP